MKKMKKPRVLLAQTLCLILVLCLVACGPTGTAGAPAASTSGAAPSQEATTAPATTAAGTAEAGTTAGAADTAPASGDGEPLDITAMIMMYEAPPDPEGEFWLDMEAKYNINYEAEWVQNTSYSDKLALVLSTNDLPDIIQVGSITEASVVKAIEAGQFRDFTDELDFNKYPNLGAISPSAWLVSTYHGRNYVFPRTRGYYNMAQFVRSDLIEKYNLTFPETIDDLTAYYEAIVAEPGMIPIPAKITDNISYFQPCFGPGNIIPVYTEDGNGIVPQQLTESYALTLEWMNSLYAKGLVAKEFALFNETQTADTLLAGKGGYYFKNYWHCFRLNEEIKKSVPDGEVEGIWGLEGPGGVTVAYDTGFGGGIVVNAQMEDERFAKLINFFEQTSDPDSYFYFTYGMEGVHYNLVDGFPSLTEEGKKVVNNSFYCPFTTATDLFQKVDSPLAPPEYNKESREKAKALDTWAAKIPGAPFTFFGIIVSKSWSDFWSLTQDDFNAFITDVVTGEKTVDEFRAYQQELLADPAVETAMGEFKTSYDEFNLANWGN